MTNTETQLQTPNNMHRGSRGVRRAAAVLALAATSATGIACAPGEAAPVPDDSNATTTRKMLSQIEPGVGYPTDDEGDKLDMNDTLEEALPILLDEFTERAHEIMKFDGVLGYTGKLQQAIKDGTPAYVVDKNQMDTDTTVYKVRYGVPTAEKDSVGNVIFEENQDTPAKVLTIFTDNETGNPTKVVFKTYNGSSEDQPEIGSNVLNFTFDEEEATVARSVDGTVDMTTFDDGKLKNDTVNRPTDLAEGFTAVNNFLVDASNTLKA